MEGMTAEALTAPIKQRKKYPEDPRPKITIRVTADDLRSIDALAAALDISRSQWLALLARSQLTEVPQLVRPEVDALLDSCRSLRAVGNNLNQIARVLNRSPVATDQAAGVDIARLSETITAHTEQVFRLINGAAKRWERP